MPPKTAKPYLTNEDRIQMKVRNPLDGKFVSKSFKYSDHNGKDGAIEASKKWAEDVAKLIDEKNQMVSDNKAKARKERTPEDRLKREIEELRSNERSDLRTNNVPMGNIITQPHPMVNTSAIHVPQVDIKSKAFPYSSWIPEKTGASLVLIGKSKSGKTSFLKKIVSHLPKNIIKIVISPNIHNDIYESMRNKCVYSPVFDSQIVKLCQKINSKTKNFYSFVIILDDIVDEKSNTTVLKMFLTMRNSMISSILSLQSPMLVNKLVRQNVNYSLLGKQNNEEGVLDTYKKFLTNFAGDLGIKKNEDVVPVYNHLTNDYNFIFVNHLKDKIYKTNKSLDGQ
jgi:hypothetical protein